VGFERSLSGTASNGLDDKWVWNIGVLMIGREWPTLSKNNLPQRRSVPHGLSYNSTQTCEVRSQRLITTPVSWAIIYTNIILKSKYATARKESTVRVSSFVHTHRGECVEGLSTKHPWKPCKIQVTLPWLYFKRFVIRNQLKLNDVTSVWSVVDNEESSYINLSSNVSNLWPTLFAFRVKICSRLTLNHAIPKTVAGQWFLRRFNRFPRRQFYLEIFHWYTLYWCNRILKGLFRDSSVKSNTEHEDANEESLSVTHSTLTAAYCLNRPYCSSSMQQESFLRKSLILSTNFSPFMEHKC
jgi:hypothetical protein